MGEEKLQSFHQSLLAMPNIKGIPTDYNQFRTVFDDPTKGDSFFKSLKANPNIKGLPDTYDAFMSGLIQKTEGIEAPKPSGQFTPEQKAEFENKGILGRAWTGLKKATIGGLGGIENMIAEYLPMAQAAAQTSMQAEQLRATTTMPRKMREEYLATVFPNKIPTPQQNYHEALRSDVVKDLQRESVKNIERASQIYGKGVAFTAGTFAPLVLGTSAAALASPFTAGTSLAFVPSLITGATLGGMTADIIGNSLYEQDKYAKEHGIKEDPITKNAIALGSGLAMFAAGKVIGSSSEYVNKLFGKAMGYVMENSKAPSVNLMREYIAKNPQKVSNVIAQVTKKMVGGATKTGGTMGTMTAMQDLLANVYKNPEDRAEFETIAKDTWNSVKSGALLHVFLGPAEVYQSNKFNSFRRSTQGINIVQTKDGNVYERYSDDPKNPDKVIVLNDKLNTQKINRKDIVDGFSMTVDEKNEYLDAWKNHQEILPKMEESIKKNAIYRQSMKIADDLAFQGPRTLITGKGIGGLKQAGKFVRMIQGNNGDSYFVTREMPAGETELAQLFPRGDGTYGVKKFTVRNLDYSKVTDMPVQDYANMAVDYYTNIKPSTPEGKAEEFTTPEEASAPENAEATINNYGQNIKFNSNIPLSEDQNPSIVIVSHKMEGKKFFITGESDQNGDHIYTGFDVDALKETGFDFTKVSPEFIKDSDIRERMDIPYNEWLQNELNLYNQTKQQADQVIAQTNAPVQEGQEITLKDKNFIVTQTGQEGVQLNEINEKGEVTGESITVTPDKYGEVFGIPARNEPSIKEEPALPAETAQPEAIQPGVKTAKLGKTNITYQEQPDGSFLIPANASDDVEKIAKQVRNEVDTDNFDVVPVTEEVPIPDVAPFAKVKTQKVTTGIRIVPKVQAQPEQVQIKPKEEPKNAEKIGEGNQPVITQGAPGLGPGEGGAYNLRNNERTGMAEQQKQETTPIPKEEVKTTPTVPAEHISEIKPVKKEAGEVGVPVKTTEKPAEQPIKQQDLIAGIGSKIAELQSREAKVDHYQRLIERYEKKPDQETKDKILKLEKNLEYQTSYFDLNPEIKNPVKPQTKNIQFFPNSALKGKIVKIKSMNAETGREEVMTANAYTLQKQLRKRNALLQKLKDCVE